MSAAVERGGMPTVGELVRLRALQSEDYARWLEWINDPDVMAGLDRALPATPEQHELYIRKNVTENRHAVWFAIDTLDRSELVGVIWLWDIEHRHRRAEARLLIGPDAAGKGYGSDALRVLCEYAFNTLGLHKIYAFVHESNERSRAAFERAGFSVEAKLREEAFRSGAFADVWRMARFSED